MRSIFLNLKVQRCVRCLCGEVFKMLRKTLEIVILLMLMISTGANARESKNAFLEDVERGLDGVVEQVMRESNTPGMAVGVIFDGDIVISRGYGVKELGADGPITADTKFNIASLRKLMTATMIAQLAEDDVLGLDEPIIRYLPNFNLKQSWIAQNVTFRDFLSHRSMIGDDDWLDDVPDVSSEDLLSRTPHIDQIGRFRDGYSYSNLGYTLAAMAAARAAQTDYESLMSEKIFRPIEIDLDKNKIQNLVSAEAIALCHECSADGGVRGQAAIKSGVDLASPHGILPAFKEPDAVRLKKRFEPDPLLGWRINPVIYPAGSNTYLSVNEMLKWLNLQLNALTTEYIGDISGDAILQTRAVASRFNIRSPNTNEDWLARYALTPFGYGMGTGLSMQDGRMVLMHGGTGLGYLSEIRILPEINAAIVVMANNMLFEETSYSSGIVADYLTSRLLGQGEVKVDRIALDRIESATKEKYTSFLGLLADCSELQADRRQAFQNVIGSYQDPYRGVLTIRQKGDKLLASQGRTRVGDVQLCGADDLALVWWRGPRRLPMSVKFKRDIEGRVAGAWLPERGAFGYDYDALKGHYWSRLDR